MTDPHVHLRDWSQGSKETVAHGLAVAAACGFTRVFDMPNTDPALTSREAVLKRLELAEAPSEETGVAYSVHMGLTADPAQIREAVAAWKELFPRVAGLKMFAGHSTGNMGIVSEEGQRLVFRTLAEEDYRGVVTIHCEKEGLLKPGFFVPGKWDTWSDARPAGAEAESIRDMLRFSEEEGCRGGLHIAHISTAEGIRIVCEAKREGRDVTCGTTPHHALLCTKDAEYHDTFLKMNPPLRNEDDRDAVFRGLLDGSVDWAESDHAPHTLPDKEKGASGIPGLPGMLLLLDALRKAGATEERLGEVFSSACCRRFGVEDLSKGLPSNPRGLYLKTRGEYPFDPFAHA